MLKVFQQFGGKRKVFLLDRQFQLSFIVFMVGISLVVTMLFYIADNYFFMQMIQKGKDIGLADDHVFFKFLSTQKKTMDTIFIITSISIFLVISLFSLIMSHKIAGPIYHLQKHIDELISGKASGPLKFRKGDYFLGLETKVNNLIQVFTSTKK